MIIHSRIAPNGAMTGVHIVHRAVAENLNEYLMVDVNSYASEDAYVARADVLWSTPVKVPLGAIAGGLLASIEGWLTSSQDSPFTGGVVVADSRDTVEGLRQRKIAAMNAACQAQIVTGFVSDALGVPHLYPTKEQDQTNLLASVTDSLLAYAVPDWTTPFWCCDDGGIWGYRPHTIVQIQQVGREAKAAILQAQGKNEALRKLIDAATIEQLQDIQWDTP